MTRSPDNAARSHASQWKSFVNRSTWVDKYSVTEKQEDRQTSQQNTFQLSRSIRRLGYGAAIVAVDTQISLHQFNAFYDPWIPKSR